MNRYGEFTVYYKTNITESPYYSLFTLTSYRQKTLEQFAVQQGVYAKVHVIPEL